MTSFADFPRDSHVTFAADVSELAPLRAAFARLARQSGAPSDVAETFELVVSELATNVIQHSTSKTVTIAFERTDTNWQLLVSGADELDLDEPRAVPDPTQPAGRGLFIVEAAMDLVELVMIDGRRHVRCIKHAA
ncbi:ATP-binding protein [Ilumatobacter sp.]|jgi:anti-sigma regulatory factor (Ser/Thr protein kinase)|uniref:ATP-binding protein n=1 Tax=Ilumatobacter sp. TaxID=1967498 RepID=UPI003750D92B